MIRTESEYQRALQQLEQGKTYIEEQREHFQEIGLEAKSLERAIQPSLSFHEHLKEEVEAYENMKRGDIGKLRSLSSIGRWLIGARIAKGWSQKELAQRLGVSEAQVSRDERNEYHGITVERAQRILEAMDFHFRMEEEIEISSFIDELRDEAPRKDENGESITAPPALNVPDQIAAFLRGDPKLNEKKAGSLAQMFRIAYETIANSDEGEDSLRAG